MIVTCPNCGTQFEVPDDKYRPGRKARCSNCGFIFPLPEIETDGREDAGKSAPDAAPFAGSGAAPAEGLPSSPEALPSPKQAGISGLPDAGTARNALPQEEVASLVPPASVDDAVLPSRKKAPPRRNKNNILFILLVVLVLALLSYGGIMVYSAFFASSGGSDPARITDGGLVRSLGGGASEEDREKEAARQAVVRRLALENVRQHTVTENEKTGPLVVIEGTVVNNFDTPKDLILLEITLYDNQGNALVLREQYCGVTLSLLQLRTLSKPALEAALSNQVAILTNNTDIPPGGRVPFTTVFFDLPNSAYEFEVRIVDVRDPAPKQ